MQSVVAFPVTPKYLTLNNLNWLFRVKLFLRQFGWLRPCDVCADIRLGSLEKNVKRQWGRALTLVLNMFS